MNFTSRLSEPFHPACLQTRLLPVVVGKQEVADAACLPRRSAALFAAPTEVECSAFELRQNGLLAPSSFAWQTLIHSSVTSRY